MNIDIDKKLSVLEESLAKIEENSVNPPDVKGQERGRWLEDLTVLVAPYISDWDLDTCNSYAEWPNREDIFPELTGQDLGIDVVGNRNNGKFVAIQCKARKLDSDGHGQNITKNEIDSFGNATQNADVWEEKWLVTNGDNPLSATAIKVESTIPNPIKIINLAHDIQMELDASRPTNVDGNTSKSAMQAEAVHNCVKTLTEHLDTDSGSIPKGQARGRLILPCGTGKTRISLRVLENLPPPLDINYISCILCPSIALVAQIRREYLLHSNTRIDALAVCSDKTAGVSKKDEGLLPENDPTIDTSFVSANEVRGRVTTNVDEIINWIENPPKSQERLRIIFGTYQSARAISDALLRTNTMIHVLVCDEAHRTAGIQKPKSKKATDRTKDFTLCHNQEQFPARYRLYQTATPRVYSNEKRQKATNTEWAVRTMDDEATFGVELYRRSYVEAVENGWLCDYRIIAIGVNDDDTFAKANKLASMARAESVDSLKTAHYLRGLAFALAMSGATRQDNEESIAIGSCIGFMNTTEKSKKMSNDLLQEEVQQYIAGWFKQNKLKHKPAQFQLKHLQASNNVTERQQALKNLAQSSYENPYGILNVGIFGEGTDSPSLNAVAFLEPRKSPIDVIQAVGRAMRTAPGKQVGYIIAPVLIPPTVDPEDWLSTSTMEEGWQELGEILLALRAHDGRIESKLGDLLQFYLPSDPKYTRNLVAVVNQNNEIEYYEQEGPSGSVFQDIEKVVKREKTPRQANFIKLLNRSKRDWRVSKPGLMVTARPTGDQNKVEVRISDVQWKRQKGQITEEADIPKCKKRLQEMINKGAGRRKSKRDDKEITKPAESAGLRLLRLSDAFDNEKAIQLNLLNRSGLHKDRVDRDLNVLQESVTEAARYLLLDELEPLLSKHFGMNRLSQPRGSKKRARATTIASLILMNAAMMQHRIDETGYINTTYKLTKVKNHPTPINYIRRCWTDILKTDYTAVFEPAVEILDRIEDESQRLGGLESAIRHIAGEATRIADTYADMGMDHAGPLFNKVMGDQASDGAFFTRPIAATLLANLAFNGLGNVNWSDPSMVQQTKIVDLACGSGTLLAACLSEIRRRVSEYSVNPTVLSKLHRTAVEHSLKGFDINPVSLQLAASQLSIGNAEIRFKNMGLHKMKYGRELDGRIHAGTLEFIDQNDIVPKRDLMLEHDIESEVVWKENESKVDARTESALEAVSNARLVIMNPPFSNRQKMGEKFNFDDQVALRRRIDSLEEQLIRSNSDLCNVIDKNSIEPMFTILTKFVLKSDGVLAMVMPTVMTSASSSKNKRQYLASHYHVHTILTCHHPQNRNLSEGCDINESMLIARRTESITDTRTKFINLDKLPTNEIECRELLYLLRNSDLHSSEWGTVFYWPARRIQDGDWSPAIWRDPELAEACQQMTNLEVLVSLRDLQNIKVHATGQILRGSSFSQTTQDTPECFPVIKSKGKDAQLTLCSKADSYYLAKGRNPKDNKLKLLSKAAYLLITSGQSTSTARLTAVAGPSKYVGNFWFPVTGLTEIESKALSVWFNSTPGRLLLMRSRGNSLIFPNYSASEVRNIPVPDIQSNTFMRQILYECYQKTRFEVVPLFSDGECRVRKIWDRAVEQVLGWEKESLDDWRNRLHNEPWVSGRSYTEYTDAPDEKAEIN